MTGLPNAPAVLHQGRKDSPNFFLRMLRRVAKASCHGCPLNRSDRASLIEQEARTAPSPTTRTKDATPRTSEARIKDHPVGSV